MGTKLKVLVLDDDENAREALADWVNDRDGFEVLEAADVAEARRLIERDQLALALLDLELPDGSGLELVDALDDAETDVVIVTGHATVESAIEAVRGGVVDYLQKPPDAKRLETILEKTRRTQALRAEVASLRGELRRLGRFGPLVGRSASMQTVYDLVQRVAPSTSTALLVGETGAGKDLVAQTIHRLSRRADGPFVAVNCGAVPEALIENELFGHEKGAFTGADRDRRGIFERAHGGTLFLDEITEMPVELQVRLLRVLETRKVTRLGGEREVEVDVRLVAATNRPLDEAVADGKLREDLRYRLDVFPIEVPPLRDRPGDVALLARAFLEQLNAERDAAKRLTDAAVDALESRPWPGNVRELKNAIERAFLLASDGDEIGADAVDPDASPSDAVLGGDGDTSGGAAPPPRDRVAVTIGSSIAKMEKELILATLEARDGDKKAAAKILGISVKTLYARLKLYEGGPD